MNILKKYGILFSALIILAGAVSCAHDPNTEPVEKWYIEFGDPGGKRVFIGETINVSLELRDQLYGSEDKATVEFRILSGGGMLSSFTPDIVNGKLTTVWTLGGDSFKNTLRADLYRQDGFRLTSRDLNAYCFVPGQWNKIVEQPDKGFSYIAADTIAGVTLALSYGNVYRQGGRYYIWEEVTDPLIFEARSVNVDNSGVFYITTWKGDVVKSVDHALTWIKCTRPYPEIPYFVYITVSNDGYIWVGRYDAPSKFSKDGGLTWQLSGDNFPSSYNGNIFRLKNGAIICHGTNKPDKKRLQISFDDGLTWITRETPGYSTNMYVNEKDELFIGTQENGYTFYRTNDLGLTFERLYSVYPKWGTIPDANLVHKWKDMYYIGIPGFGVLKSPDLVHYEKLWETEDIFELFIDHTGTLIARSRNWEGSYYYKPVTIK
ncbi:MAG: WD40/YVTN/BNR-like repeat-containing protein [Chloroflexota bacterium]